MTAPATTTRPAPESAAAEVWTQVERAQAGDAEAFGLIYNRYRESIFRFVYFRCGNRQLAEDLTADTFERALKRIGSFTWQGRDLGAWLVTIARNLVMDHWKCGRVRLELLAGEVLDPERQSAVGANRGRVAPVEPSDPAEDAAAAEVRRVLTAGLRELTDQQREVIELRFWAGLSVAEAAAKMGLNEGACKAVQYRAVRALARLPGIQALRLGAES